MDTGNVSIPKRHPRFVRHHLAKPSFQMQDRDREIVRLVSQYRVISSADVQLLSDGSDQAILRRLQRLFHHGYLDRPRSQRQIGNAPMVYALGQQGAELIARETGQKPVADWAEKNRQLRTHYLQHALMISRFHTALQHACVQGGTVLLERWLPDGAVADAVMVEHRDCRVRIPIRPDAFFILNVLDGEQGGRVHIVLEADRGTMAVPRFTKKLHGYFAWWRSGKAQERLGGKNFLVATVTRSQERADNLLAAARSVSDRGLRMFIFTPESAYLPVAAASAFNAIWRTPAADDRHSLLE